MRHLRGESYNRFCDIAYRAAGIAFTHDKQAFVSARVSGRMRQLDLESAEAYLDYLLNDTSGAEVQRFLDTMTTNVTSFLREPDHFELLRSLARRWSGRRSRLRLWSAGCSSGEEPYSMAMALSEGLDDPRTDVQVLATDISTRMLSKARSGSYPEKSLAHLPQGLRDEWFIPATDGEGPTFRVTPRLRRMVTFHPLNLAQPPFPMQGPMDVVFCRNVMIYFDRPTRRALVSEVERLLRPGGYLVTSHAESLRGIARGLRAVRPSVYQKHGGGS